MVIQLTNPAEAVLQSQVVQYFYIAFGQWFLNGVIIQGDNLGIYCG